MFENGDEMITRLLKCGFDASNARAICYCYAAKADYEGLETFICFQEERKKRELQTVQCKS